MGERMRREHRAATKPVEPRGKRIAVATLVLMCALTGCGDSSEQTPAPTPAAASLDADGCTPAQQPQPKTAKLNKPTVRLDAAVTYVATVKTNCGAFEITLDVTRAPETTASFKALADQRLYDGTTVHRIVPGFVISRGGHMLPCGRSGAAMIVTACR